jgi:hypothetical protein
MGRLPDFLRISVQSNSGTLIAEGGMRARNFGYMTGDVPATLFLRFALVTLAAGGFALAQFVPAQQDSPARPAVSEAPLTAEQLAVYHAVLHGWMDDSKHVLNVSVTTDPLTADAADCAKGLDAEPATPVEVHRFQPQDLPMLGSNKIRFVDPGQQSKEVTANDPEAKIQSGSSISGAVSNGFAHGLVTLSEIQFDKQHRHAVVSYDFTCGRLCGNGGTVLMEKRKGAWVAVSKCHDWIS